MNFLRYLGPGLFVTVGFIDPGNWASNIAAGSGYGYELLWMVTLSTIMLIFLQHNAAHLGIVTGKCLSEAASFYLPAWLKNTILATAMMAAVATAMAEILGGAIALQMLFGIPIKLGSMMILVLVLICEFTSAYKRIEKLIIVFVSLIGFSFLFEVWIADIDWAQIKDLTAGTAIIEKGVNGKLYVADLAVTEANMASLTVGELIVKGADGCFYALSIAEDGTVTTEKKSVGDADISDNSVSGSKLIEKTITARELNIASIFADEALVGAITAANIDVSSLFAAEAFIAQLNAVDISGNESLRLVVDTAKDEALDATGEAVAQIALTAEQIRSEVKRDYATADQVGQMNETLSTLAEQSENNFTWTVTKVNEIIEDAAANDNLTREQLNLIHTYMRFGEDGLTIGKAGNPLTFRVVNDRLAFYMNDTEVAYLSDNKLYVTQAEILARLQIGKFAYEPQSNGNLSVIYTG